MRDENSLTQLELDSEELVDEPGEQNFQIINSIEEKKYDRDGNEIDVVTEVEHSQLRITASRAPPTGPYRLYQQRKRSIVSEPDNFQAVVSIESESLEQTFDRMLALPKIIAYDHLLQNNYFDILKTQLMPQYIASKSDSVKAKYWCNCIYWAMCEYDLTGDQAVEIPKKMKYANTEHFRDICYGRLTFQC